MEQNEIIAVEHLETAGKHQQPSKSSKSHHNKKKRGPGQNRNFTNPALTSGTVNNAAPPGGERPETPPIDRIQEEDLQNHDQTIDPANPPVPVASNQDKKPGEQQQQVHNRFDRQYGRTGNPRPLLARPRVLKSKINTDVETNHAGLPPSPPETPPGLTWSSPSWRSIADSSKEQKVSSSPPASRDIWGEIVDKTADDKSTNGRRCDQSAQRASISNIKADKSHRPQPQQSPATSAVPQDHYSSWNQADNQSCKSSADPWITGNGPGAEGSLPDDIRWTVLPGAKIKHIRHWRDSLPHPSTWDRPQKCPPVEYWIVPRQWMQYEPLEAEKLSVAEFYRDYFHRLRMLQPTYTLPKPWWEHYLDSASPFLRRPYQPEAQLNPKDDWYARAKGQDSTAEARIRSFMLDFIEPLPEAPPLPLPMPVCPRKVQPIRRAVNIARPSMIARNNQNRNPYRKPPVDRGYQGKANIYLRLATAADAQQLQDIYNHFVDNTWFVPEKTALTLQQMQDRLAEVEAAEWPWLVAVERSSNNRNNHNSRRQRGSRPNTTRQSFMALEKILGFAYAHDHISADSTDHVTAQIQLWVLPECQNSKVGTTLMDRLLFCLLEDYEPFTDAEYRVYQSPFDVAGGCKRKLHSLLASMQYAPAGKDEARANIVQGFLCRYSFEQCGEQKEVGWRKNLYLNRKLFQRMCRENADGAHSDLGAQYDTPSIIEGEPRYFRAEDDTFDKREERRLAVARAAADDGLRPLPLIWKPVVRR